MIENACTCPAFLPFVARSETDVKDCVRIIHFCRTFRDFASALAAAGGTHEAKEIAG